MASTYLTRTPSSSGNRKTWTWSAWIKKSKLGNVENIFTAGSSSDDGAVRYLSGGNFNLYETNSNGTAYSFNLETNALYRDVNGWYHLVVAVDTTQATASNRVKMYVNGSQVTFTGSAYPSQNFDTFINKDAVHQISKAINTTYGTREFDGSMSHIHFIDGIAYDASAFGSTDSTTGEWSIKISPSVTYGTNGFFILKDGNSVTDQSGNSNNFTVAGGTLTKTEDNPSNVFATWNPLVKPWAGYTTWTYGNTRGYNSDSLKGSLVTTLGATSGKYYMEVKQENSNGVWIGVAGDGFVSDNITNLYSGQTQNATTGLLIKYSDGTKATNGTQTSTGFFDTTGQGDITGIAIDLDAGTRTVTFYKNGVADSAGSQDLPTNMQTGAIFGCAIVHGGSAVNLNAGNGYFQTTAVSSAGTNASNNGIFEYDVPAGYTALSTKGLNE